MWKNRSTTAALAAAVCLAATGAVQAQNAPAQAPGMHPPAPGMHRAAWAVAQADRDFAMKAAAAGMAEVEQGKLAQRKAQSDAVKQFGQRMVNDHSKANEELQRIAGGKGIDVPDKLDHSAQSEIDKLEKLSGAKFDAAYMDHQVSAHHKAIALFEKEAQSGKDNDLKRFADDTVPTLREHLKLAESAQATADHESQAKTGSSSHEAANAKHGVKAAKAATGAEAVAAEKADRMPVPKTGM